MQAGFSEYAKRVADLRRDKRRSKPLFGLTVHTSGSGILRRAKESGKDPDDLALDYYDSSNYSTNYVAGHRNFYQLTSVREQVSHIGYTKGVGGNMSGAQRRAWYHSGQWRRDMPEFAKRWDRAWPGKASPSSLHPSRYPNMDFAAIECIPAAEGFGFPMEGTRFSLAQHCAVALCALELAIAEDWPDDFELTGRLAGHEDLGPHSRVGPWNNPRDGESWDPGRHRERPWISWPTIQQFIQIGRGIGLDSLNGLLVCLYAPMNP